MNYRIEDLTLEGESVRLIPLQEHHKKDLLEVASDGNLWELWYTSVPSIDTIDEYVLHAIRQRDIGKEYPFAVLHKASQTIIGCTRFYNIQPEHKRLEIGYTWYSKSFQQTGVNTECKYLLLAYAFEELGTIAVQFMTDWFNLKSRAAIARLGAKQDGVLRQHRINKDGSYRDSVVFSITNQEWKGVKKSLEYKLKSYK